MKLSTICFFILLSFFFASCSTGPQPINYGKDACDFCKMNIVDEKFAVQCLNINGKSFRFDDVHCLVGFMDGGSLPKEKLASVYFADNNKKDNWIKSDIALLLQSDSLRSPMGGNIIAFDSEQARDEAMKQFNGKQLLWKDINPFEKK
jgi:copper chaperone NosL